MAHTVASQEPLTDIRWVRHEILHVSPPHRWIGYCSIEILHQLLLFGGGQSRERNLVQIQAFVLFTIEWHRHRLPKQAPQSFVASLFNLARRFARHPAEATAHFGESNGLCEGH